MKSRFFSLLLLRCGLCLLAAPNRSLGATHYNATSDGSNTSMAAEEDDSVSDSTLTAGDFVRQPFAPLMEPLLIVRDALTGLSDQLNGALRAASAKE